MLVGCTESVAWDRGIRPVAAPGSSPAFVAKVEAAVLVWRGVLACPDLMTGAAGTGPVYEVTTGDFATIGAGQTVSGMTWTDKVWINNERPELENEILVHELGHVLGLEHVSIEEDPGSVMHPNDDGIVIPDDDDVQRVGCR